MKKTLKHVFLLLSLAILLIASCRKDTTSQAPSHATDFRDSLVGSYVCTTINSYGNPGSSGSDTIRDTIVVVKSGDSAIAMSSYTFTFSDVSLGYIAPGIQFSGPVSNSVSCLNGVSFASNGSSIYWLSECYTVSTSSSSVTQGSKIH